MFSEFSESFISCMRYIFVFSDVLWASISLSPDIIKHSAVCFSSVIIKRSRFTPPPPLFEHRSPPCDDVHITDNKQTKHLLVTKDISTFPDDSIWHFQYNDEKTRKRVSSFHYTSRFTIYDLWVWALVSVYNMSYPGQRLRESHTQWSQH